MHFTSVFIASLLSAAVVLAEISQPLAGVILEKTMQPYESVGATFLVQSLSCGEGTAYLGVAVDDPSTCDAAIEAGVELACAFNSTDGTATYRAYSRSYPSGVKYYDNVTIRAGDRVHMQLTHRNQGVVAFVMDNTTSTNTNMVPLSPPEGHQLCLKNMLWFMRANQLHDGFLYPIPAFDFVTLFNVGAWTADKTDVPDEGNLLNMRDGNERYWADASLSGSNITITYVLSPNTLPG